MLLTKIGLYNNIIHLLCGNFESQWDGVGSDQECLISFLGHEKIEQDESGTSPRWGRLRLRLGVHKGRELNDHKGMEMNCMEWNEMYLSKENE